MMSEKRTDASQNQNLRRTVQNPLKQQDKQLPQSSQTLMGSDWLNVSGDVDDFIFYGNDHTVSSR